MDLVTVEEWNSSHLRWSELSAIVAELRQTDWLTARHEWHRSTYVLVARSGEVIVGFLRFVTQPIGPDTDCEPVMLDGLPLIEAKVLAFGVAPAYRQRGIGRALQEEAIRRASALGCYQVRSHSSGENAANHRLKLAMGFAIHPIVRGEDRGGAYFVLPLRRRE